MKNPNNDSIIYLVQNEKFFTLSLDKNFDINMKIFLDGDNDFVKPIRDLKDKDLMLKYTEYLIGSKIINSEVWLAMPKIINIKTIVNV